MGNGLISERSTLRRLIDFLTGIPESSLHCSFHVEQQARRVHLLFFISAIGIVIFLSLGVVFLIKKNVPLGIFYMALASILVGNLLHGRRYKRYAFNIYSGVSLVGLLFVYGLLTGGIRGTGFVWYYTFPLVASFLLGSKKGAIATSLTILPAIVFFLMKAPSSFLIQYSFDFKLRFLLSFFVVFVLSYLFQYSQEKNQEELELRRARDDLEKRVDERTAALQEAIQSLQKEIGERRRAEEELRESEERYRTILEDIEESYFETDLGGNFTFVNDIGCRRLGYTREELMGMNNRQLTDEETAKKVFQAFGEVYRTGKPRRGGEWEVIRKDGTKGIFEVSASLLRDSESRPIGFRGTSRDITERKGAEEALKEKTEELARSNRELEEFAYVSSHDLQEPLRMVTNFSQLLAKRYKGRLDSDADEFIQFAVDGATRMWKLINDLLVYSQVGTRSQTFDLLSCETILQQSLDNLKVTIEESGAVVTHDSLPTVMADGSQLGQVFQDLISNSIKFRGDNPPRVHVSVTPNGKRWTFSVCDNGIGIAPEFREKIFIIFQRLHGRDEYPGTGIGLALCKKIVERHGGRIWVESDVGRGATFYFTLPRGEGPNG